MNRQFPPEIVQLIVEASLDRYDMFRSDSRDSRPRYATLRSYSLLNSTWCGASQAELVKWVEIRANNSAIRFLELAEQRGGTLEGVRDLHVTNLVKGSSTVSKLFRSAPQVVNLCVYGRSVDIHDLAPLQQLRRIRLFNCFIVGSPSSSPLRLPQLQRLDTNRCRVEDSARRFLTPAFLPQLRHFDTDNLDIIVPLIQQLEIIVNNSHNVDYTILARADSLLLLPLPLYADERLDMLSMLPSLPPFVHINASHHSYQVLAVALEALLATTKKGLRVIMLNDHGVDDSIKSLIQRFEERGVRVQLVDEELDLYGAVAEMETIRAKEDRSVNTGVL